MAEFLVEIEIEWPPSMSDDERNAILAAEAARAKELRAAGSIVRMWRIPGRRANVGLWEVADATELHELLSSLPVFPWMSIQVRPLAQHPVMRDAGG
jgi:muconolactone D-isomerase